jgi:predicted DNA-binding transcriptional regulator AlpA
MRRDPTPLPFATGLARERERASITGIKTSQWYALQRAGKAPFPIKIGLRTVAWRRADLLAWIEAQTQ